MALEKSGGIPAVDEPISSLEQLQQQEVEKQESSQEDDVVSNQAESDSEDPAQETEEKPSERQRQRRGGFQKKIERLSSEVEYLRSQLAEKQAAVAPKNESFSAPQGKPIPDDFKTWEDYVEALADWKVDAKLELREQKKQQETLQQSYKRQIQEAQETYADFDEAIADYDFHLLPKHAQQALLHSEMGAHIAYHIANNPEVGDELAGLSPIAAAMKVGELAAQLKSKGKSVMNKAAPKVSKAPPPITPLKAKAVVSRNIYDDNLSYEDFRKVVGDS